MPLIALAVYLLIVGGWVARNWEVSGMVRLTDDRGGIALSTREVFDHMTAAQIAAAFVYWTPGGGSTLAKRLFSPDTVAPFDLYAPGGFYDRGQNGYGRRVEALMRSGGEERPAPKATGAARACSERRWRRPRGFHRKTPGITPGGWFVISASSAGMDRTC